MKGILVVLDGLGDLPCKALKGKTPLEAANKPNLDYLSEFSKFGYAYTDGEGVIPESDSGVLSLLGNPKLIGYRGVFEALGAGIKLQRGDLALRANFATIDNIKDKKLLDRRVGRTLTTKEATILAEAINKNVKLPCKFIFQNTVQHRGVLVLRGGFSDNITNTDPEYHTKGVIKIRDRLSYSQPLDDEDNTKYSSDMVNQFIDQSFKVLNEHKINLARKDKGLLPANVILTRDASMEIPKINKFKDWASVSYMPLEIGICKASNIAVFSFPYPELENVEVYENLYSGLKEAIKFSVETIKENHKNYDYFYVHFKETDIPGHDNLPEEKKKMIELIDKEFFSFLKEFTEKKKIFSLVTADHSTLCEKKSHSADPVPVLFCDWKNTGKKNFSEKEALSGKLGKIQGKDLLKMVGFLK